MEEKDPIVETVENNIDNISKIINYGGKTVAQWQAYFSVKIEDPNNQLHLRQKLMEIGNKLDECVVIYSNIKMSLRNLELREFQETHKRIIEDSDAKTITAKERNAKQSVYRLTAAKKLNEMLIVPWEEMKFNLARKAKDVEAQLWSVSSEIRNLSRTGIYEE